MITFFRQSLGLLRRRARVRFVLAGLLMMVQAGMEATALVAIAPLLSILTSAGLHSSSHLVGDLSRFLGNPSAGHLALYLGIFTVGLYLLKDLLAIATFRWAMGFSLEEEVHLVGRLSRLYLYAPYRRHLETNSAEHVRTLTASIRTIFQQGYVTSFVALGNLVSVVLIAGILFAVSPLTALAACVYFGAVTVLYQRVINRVLGRQVTKLHQGQALDIRNITQAIAGVKEIKVRGSEEGVAQEIEKLRRGLVPAYRTMALVQMTPRYVLELSMLGAATTIAAVAFSSEPLASATATLGLFLVGGFRLLAPLNTIIFGNAQAKAAAPALAQIRSDLEVMRSSDNDEARGAEGANTPDGLPAHPDGTFPARPPNRPDGRAGARGTPLLEVCDVSFSYKPGTRVLRDVSFAVAAGETIGLVGGSGAGKTTLVDVALGLLEPEAGCVLANGEDLRSVRRRWTRSVGYVPQTIALFDDTITVNVAFGDPVDEAAVWAALRLAQLDELVEALPEGLDTLVGEAGTRLSGGQRQRLGVARALYRRPSFLVFDEATSALDNETEFRLTEVLETLRGQTTTLTIAHRLSTVRRCDRILYLEQGRLVAEGTFDELAESSAGFSRLVELSTLRG